MPWIVMSVEETRSAQIQMGEYLEEQQYSRRGLRSLQLTNCMNWQDNAVAQKVDRILGYINSMTKEVIIPLY